MAENSPSRKRILGEVDLIVFDFDGVLTDNRVLVFEDGREAVLCSRTDGLAFDMLRAASIGVMIMSTERNPVVAARAAQVCVPVLQALADKGGALVEHCRVASVDLRRVAFIGNDVNDLSAMRLVGYPIAVADAHPEAKKIAWLVLATRGGDGVAREIAETLLGLQHPVFA